MKVFAVDFLTRTRHGRIKTIFIGIMLLLVAVALAGCGSSNSCGNDDQTTMPVSTNGKNAIYTNIYVGDHYSDTPISGAFVRITNQSTGNLIDSGYTDGNGQFVGIYQYDDTSLVVCVAVSKTGYVSQSYCNLVMDTWNANGKSWAQFDMQNN